MIGFDSARFATSLAMVALLSLLTVVEPGPARAQESVAGLLKSGEMPLAGYRVTLFATRGSDEPASLGTAISDQLGAFEIAYPPQAEGSVLYLVGEQGVRALAAVLGTSADVVLNERTTVATAYALAQFAEAGNLAGPSPGLQNAAAMSANLADVATGDVGGVLASPPNGPESSTLRTFNSLANMIAACVQAKKRCPTFLDRATSPAGVPPADTFEAVTNIARNPWQNVEPLFRSATTPIAPYRPALLKAPDAWTIVLRFEGDRTMNGPGNLAIDADGNVWVNDNYEPGGRFQSVCAGETLYKFTPTGRLFPDAPYTGGGLSGAGFGITLDPRGHVWVSNFGFQAPACQGTPDAAKNNSVSEFLPSGEPLSPDDGYTAGELDWPQGMASDQRGSIWVTNCGNNSVTLYRRGRPAGAANFDFGRIKVEKPFDVAIDGEGRAWVTGNANSVVSVLNGRGSPVAGSPFEGPAFDRPKGIASDSRGNMWVANSGIPAPPCSDGDSGPKVPLIEQGDDDPMLETEAGGSVTLIRSSGDVDDGAPFFGGGLALPWGIAVDGNDNVWVANFGSGLGEGGSRLARISQICGTDPEHCPPGLDTGDPISPPTGYTSDALRRLTGVAIDPSGNLWAANNWQFIPLQNNPGGRTIAVFVGIAAPIETPLIGPPKRPRG